MQNPNIPFRTMIDLVEAANRIDESYGDIQNPTLEKVIDYMKRRVRDYKHNEKDEQYAPDDMETALRALEAILKNKGK